MNEGTDILIVDDDLDVLDLVEALLQDAGYRTHCCNDADAALSLLRDSGLKPALALLDILMPVIDGHQLALALRERMPTLPILFMTGFARSQAPAGLDNAPVAMVLKPFRPDQLLAEIARLLAGGAKG